MESRGDDVTYISNTDTHADPAGLGRAKGFLSVGHDEYYTIEMFSQLKEAIAGGLNVAFLSGNVCCGRIDLRPGSDGTPHRIFNRADRFGGILPEEGEALPEVKLFPSTTPNENTLVGARTVVPAVGTGDWICRAPDHWLFEGTGMKEGEGIPALVGWEYHGDPADLPGLEIVASGATQSHHGPGAYTATVYPGPRGNFVFNASTCWWGDGLSEPPGYVRPFAHASPEGPDARVQRITANVLARMRG